MTPLRVLVAWDAHAWIAVCLERYVMAQGSDEEDALDGLSAVWRAQSDLNQRESRLWEDIMAAPAWAHAQYLALPAGYEWHCAEYGADRTIQDRVFEVRKEPKR